jgi:hypothetical protein
MEYYHFFKLCLDFLSTIFWPLTTLIIFYFLREPIINLINNVKRFSYGSSEFETHPNNSQFEVNSNIANNLGAEYIDEVLAKFSPAAKTFFQSIIEKDISINEVQPIQLKYELLYKYTTLLILMKDFDRIYDLIYGSQIKILQRLSASITESKIQLKPYYDFASSNNIEWFKNYPFDNYLSFLSSNRLISVDNENSTITITDFGKDLNQKS